MHAEKFSYLLLETSRTVPLWGVYTPDTCSIGSTQEEQWGLWSIRIMEMWFHSKRAGLYDLQKCFQTSSLPFILDSVFLRYLLQVPALIFSFWPWHRQSKASLFPLQLVWRVISVSGITNNNNAQIECLRSSVHNLFCCLCSGTGVPTVPEQ